MRILVVDDEEDLRTATASLMRRLFPAACVLEAANGLEALERASEQRPDVIVSDLQMPFVDGPTLVEALRGRPALVTVPVILLGTDAGLPAVAAALEVAGHLAKPVSPLALARELGRCLGRPARLAAAAAAATLTRRALRARSRSSRG
jgi:two-component system, chemotaxis family, chemotaxis protein CheY